MDAVKIVLSLGGVLLVGGAFAKDLHSGTPLAEQSPFLPPGVVSSQTPASEKLPSVRGCYGATQGARAIMMPTANSLQQKTQTLVEGEVVVDETASFSIAKIEDFPDYCEVTLRRPDGSLVKVNTAYRDQSVVAANRSSQQLQQDLVLKGVMRRLPPDTDHFLVQLNDVQYGTSAWVAEGKSFFGQAEVIAYHPTQETVDLKKGSQIFSLKLVDSRPQNYSTQKLSVAQLNAQQKKFLSRVQDIFMAHMYLGKNEDSFEALLGIRGIQDFLQNLPPKKGLDSETILMLQQFSQLKKMKLESNDFYKKEDFLNLAEFQEGKDINRVHLSGEEHGNLINTENAKNNFALLYVTTAEGAAQGDVHFMQYFEMPLGVAPDVPGTYRLKPEYQESFGKQYEALLSEQAQSLNNLLNEAKNWKSWEARQKEAAKRMYDPNAHP